MAWVRALLSCKSWWQKLLGRNNTNKDGQNEKDCAPSIDRAPISEEKRTTTKYINCEKVVEHIVVKTKHIDGRGHTCVSNCDSNTVAETRHSALSSISLSDQDTIIENAKAVEGPELFAVNSPYVNDSTGEWMVRLYYDQPVNLNDLEIRGLESHIPESDDASIEARCRYRGKEFWLSLPYR
ncbi:hypothetical protein KXV78_007693, partial [Aspergillus fumigatus]